MALPDGVLSIAMVNGGGPYPSQPYVWTFGLQMTPVDFDADKALAKALQIGDAWDATIGISTYAEVVLREVRATLTLDGSTGTVVAGNPGTWAGGTPNAVLPPNCAAIVNKVTARMGRKGRGRFFLPMCLPEAEVDNTGNISAPQLETLQDRIDDFFEAITSGAPSGLEAQHVLLHSDSSAPSPVLETNVQQRIGTLRRRIR